MSRLILFLFCGLAMFELTGCGSIKKSSPAVTAIKPEPDGAMQQRLEWMSGHWYGDQPTKNSGRKQWIIHRAADGHFTITFKVDDPVEGKVEQLESGVWGVSGKYYAALTTSIRSAATIDSTPPLKSSLWDIYRIHNLTENELQYSSVETGNHYKSRRVSADFKMP